MAKTTQDSAARKSAPKTTKAVNLLVRWVKGCDGDVDFACFREDCDQIATIAAHEAGVRLPVGVRGRGVITLDYALSLTRRCALDIGLNSYVDLPNMREYLNAFRNGEG